MPGTFARTDQYLEWDFTQSLLPETFPHGRAPSEPKYQPKKPASKYARVSESERQAKAMSESESDSTLRRIRKTGPMTYTRGALVEEKNRT